MVYVEDLEIGSEVRMDAVGTVVRVYSHGSADIQWHDSKFENGIDVNLLELLTEEPSGLMYGREAFEYELQTCSRAELVQKLWNAQNVVQNQVDFLLKEKYGVGGK